MPLKGKTALVAGATRGAGRGISVALGEAGATVWCTGRSVEGSTPTGRPETIEQTAALVDAAGGIGIYRQVDHTVPAEVEALAKAMGPVDILVNDIWGGGALTHWGTPFWEYPLEDGLRLLELAVTTHIITARHVALRPGGLLVEITDGRGEHDRTSLFFDLAKSSTRRLARAMAHDLGDRATAVAITPGFLRSEEMLDYFGVTEDNWREASDPHFLQSESPRYVGRAIAALAADPQRHRFAGKVTSSGELGRLYGLSDIDGRTPDFGEYGVRLLVDAIAKHGLDVPELAKPFLDTGGAALLADLEAGVDVETAVRRHVRI